MPLLFNRDIVVLEVRADKGRDAPVLVRELLTLYAHQADAAVLPRVTPYRDYLAWVAAQGEDIVPLFGTKRRKYLEENLAALEVELTPDDLAQIDEVAPKGAAAGERYPAGGMKTVNA